MNERQIRIENRVSGLAMLIFGGIIGLGRGEVDIGSLGNILLTTGGALYATEGLSDLITGEHHYASSQIIKAISEIRNRRYLL